MKKNIKILIIDPDRSPHLFMCLKGLIEEFSETRFITPYHFRKSLFLDFFLNRFRLSKKKIELRDTGLAELGSVTTVFPLLFLIIKSNFFKSRPLSILIKAYYSFFYTQVLLNIKHYKPSLVISSQFNRKIIDYCKINNILTLKDAPGEAVKFMLDHLKKIESSHFTHQSRLNELIEYYSSRIMYINNNIVGLEEHDFFLVPSVNVFESFVFEGFNENRIFRLPYGTSVSVLQKNYTQQSSKIKLVFVGRVEYLKGVDFLFDALKGDLGSNFSLKIVGNITHDNDYKDELLIHEYHGYLEKQEVMNIISNSDYLILPSLSEGMSYAVLEALSLGTPAIVSNRCGYNGIIKDSHNGFVFDSGDLDSLRECLTRVYNTYNNYSEISKQAYFTSKMYSWEKYQEKLVEIVKWILI